MTSRRWMFGAVATLLGLAVVALFWWFPDDSIERVGERPPTSPSPNASPDGSYAITATEVLFEVRPVVDIDAGVSSSGNRPPGPLPRDFSPLIALSRVNCSLPPVSSSPSAPIVACDEAGARYVLGAVGIDNTNVESAEGLMPPGATTWVVSVTLDEKGQVALEDMTGAVVGAPAPKDRLAMVLDGEVVQAPTVNEQIFGGQLDISGDFSARTAMQLAAGLA